VVGKPEDKAFIPLELLIGQRDHRRREGLCHKLSVKPSQGGRKIAVIDDADSLNAEGANALLKTLEEPPPRSVLILIGVSPAKQLPTIRSRCQLVRFQPLPQETVAELLLSKGLIQVQDRQEALRLAQHGEGSLQRAMELADAELWSFRDALFGRLSEPQLKSVELAQTISALVDRAGKEAAIRRARLRQVVEFAAEFYRRKLRENCDDPTVCEQASARLERCLDAAAQIDRNANQTTLIETWLEDLAGQRTEAHHQPHRPILHGGIGLIQRQAGKSQNSQDDPDNHRREARTPAGQEPGNTSSQSSHKKGDHQAGKRRTKEC